VTLYSYQLLYIAIAYLDYPTALYYHTYMELRVGDKVIVIAHGKNYGYNPPLGTIRTVEHIDKNRFERDMDGNYDVVKISHPYTYSSIHQAGRFTYSTKYLISVNNLSNIEKIIYGV
jgi:hypothetical protein